MNAQDISKLSMSHINLNYHPELAIPTILKSKKSAARNTNNNKLMLQARSRIHLINEVIPLHETCMIPV